MTRETPPPSPLEELGIEEIEPMVCEDNHANRQRLGAEKWTWDVLRDESGGITGLIRAITPEQLKERRESVWERRKPIMVDPDNRYSEYVGPEDYPSEFDGPWWLKARLREWVAMQLGQVKSTPSREVFPARCEIIRSDGTRCWNWATRPDKAKRCKPHLSWKVSVDLQDAHLARVHLLEASPTAADNLIALSQFAESEPVRLKASTEILDRVGVRGGAELDVSVGERLETDPAQVIRDRLARLAGAATGELLPSPGAAETDIIDAEVVEDDKRPAS